MALVLLIWTCYISDQELLLFSGCQEISVLVPFTIPYRQMFMESIMLINVA